MRGLLKLSHFNHSLLDLCRSLLLVLYAKIKFFNLFLQKFVLFKKVVDEFVETNFLILSLVHNEEYFAYNFVKTDAQLLLLIL